MSSAIKDNDIYDDRYNGVSTDDVEYYMNDDDEYEDEEDSFDSEIFEVDDIEEQDKTPSNVNGNQGTNYSIISDEEVLDFLAKTAQEYAKVVGLTDEQLRGGLLDRNFSLLCSNKGLNHENLILYCSSDDVGYLSFVESLYPQLKNYLRSHLEPDKRDLLIEVLGESLLSNLWVSIKSLAVKQGKTPEYIHELFIQVTNVEPSVCKNTELPISEFVDKCTSDLKGSGVNIVSAVVVTFVFLQSLKDGVKLESTQEADTELLSTDGVHPSPSQVVEEEEEEDEDPDIEHTTSRIMEVYAELFEVGFELVPPYGMVTKEGVLRLKKKGKEDIGKDRTELMRWADFSRIYDLINGLSGGFLVQSPVSEGLEADKLRDMKLHQGVTYYPEFQLGNLFGMLKDRRVNSWREMSKHLEREVRENVKRNLKAGNDSSAIIESLTTCIAVSEYNKASLKLRINVGKGRVTKGAFEREYQKQRNSIMQGMGNLYHIEELKNGVVEVILVFNLDVFNSRPLFAYEAIEALRVRGRKPSIRELVLGQDTSGKTLTLDLDRQAACNILIGAGQRSGKGVLTLNILGTILADGNPLIYLDGKPDMARVLWDLGKKYGTRPASWDLYLPHKDDADKETKAKIGQGAPEKFANSSPTLFGVLLYLKSLQLMLVSAHLQANGVKIGNGKRPFFIFDEALAAQSAMKSVWPELVKTYKNKNKKSSQEELDWCERVVEWAESLESDFVGTLNSQLPMSGVSTIWLFQTMQPTSWNMYKVDSPGGAHCIFKQPLMSRLSIKLMGRGTADSEFALGNVKNEKIIANRILDGNGRHFAMSTSQKIASMDGLEVFKPYLVLNSVGDGSKAEAELLGAFKEQPAVLKAIAPDGHLNKKVGFEDFAKCIGADAIQNLSNGTLYLEEVLRITGLSDKYASVDDYLYDSSIDSFINTGSLVRGLNGSDDNDDKESWDYVTGGVEIESSNMGHVIDSTSTLSTDTTPNFISGDMYQGKAPQGYENNYDSVSDESQYNHMDSVPKVGLPPRQVQQGFFNPNMGQSEPNQYDQFDSSPRDTYVSPNDRSNYSNVYRNQMDIPQNPFEVYGVSEKPISAIASINIMSNYLMAEILKLVGDYRRVESLEVTEKGMVINNCVFSPRLPEDVVRSLPFDIQQKVDMGNIIELFNFSNLYKFKNLVVLRIDNSRLAEGRVRREINLHPKKTWYKLFSKFSSLRELYIGGVVITSEESSLQYDSGGRGGFDLTEKLRKAYNMGTNVVSSSRMERVWNSKPVKVITKAAGWTLGAKVVVVTSSMLGPWGLVFGGLAGYGAVKAIRKRR